MCFDGLVTLILFFVGTDITGLSGMRILDAILAGERDPRMVNLFMRRANSSSLGGRRGALGVLYA